MASGKPLNVVQRDGFFDDSFFKESWGDFDRAMQSVLDKFDNRGLKVDQNRSECRDVYSNIRSSRMAEDASQAVTINEKDGKFQVVMDVKDFDPRELQVRAVDDRIVVEGSYNKVSQDGVSTSKNSFYKEFSLPPAADIDQVTTALSKDGILTIKAPKKEGAALSEGPTPSGSNVQQSSSSSFAQANNGNAFSSSSRKVVQSSSSSSHDSFDSFPKEMREKLMFCDSGFGSSKSSTCTSPAPSEAGSESSRVSSTLEFDMNKKPSVRSEVSFNVNNPNQPSAAPMHPPGPQQGQQQQQQRGPGVQQPQQQMFQRMPQQQPQQPPQPLAQQPPMMQSRFGTGNQTSVNVTEENGRRVLTSQTSNVVQEKDGVMEHRETAAEITDANSQAARREASTRMSRQEEDPEGRFKRSEAADAAEVSESCVQHMPDGSIMTVKKSSTSSSSMKQSFNSSMGEPRHFPQMANFPSGFGDLRDLMGRGHSLMSQMSTDSMASTLSGRSGFSDMSNFSHFSDASSKFSDMSNFSNMSGFSDMSQMSSSSQRSTQNAHNFGNMQPMDPSSGVSRSFSSSSTSSFQKSFSSNFGDRNF